MKYCKRCGKQLKNDAVMCFGCGLIGDMPTFSEELNENQKSTLNTLYNKMTTAIKFWKAVSILQFIGAAFYLLLSLFVSFGYITNVLALGVIGFLNWRASSSEFEFLESIKKKPVGIVKHFEPITSLIITFIYNLIFGGIIGIIGSALDFLSRSYVMDNRNAFIEIEQIDNTGSNNSSNVGSSDSGKSNGFDAFGQR